MKEISAKLAKIMHACSYVQKTGKNTFHNYKYATAADVLEKANDAMVANGVCCCVTPELMEFRDVLTAKGATEHLATVKVSVMLIDSVSGESLHLVGLGSGQDAGDKAIMKAQTAAIKYAWMMSLNISTGDDPEADEKTDQSAVKTTTPPAANKTATPPAQKGSELITDAQRKTLYAKIDAKGMTKETAKAEILTRFGVDSSTKLTKVQAKEFIDYLNTLAEVEKPAT